MTDSSSEEDLSQFKEAIDTTFLNDDMFKNSGESETTVKKPKILPKSDRNLEETSHYNDVKVSSELQKRISDKIASIIDRGTEFIEVTETVSNSNDVAESGILLFKDSTKFLSSEEVKDTYTAGHNKRCKASMKQVIGHKSRNDGLKLSDKEKVQLAAIDADFILSKKDVKHWKSRRKEKLYCYKNSKTGILVSCD